MYFVRHSDSGCEIWRVLLLKRLHAGWRLLPQYYRSWLDMYDSLYELLKNSGNLVMRAVVSSPANCVKTCMYVLAHYMQYRCIWNLCRQQNGRAVGKRFDVYRPWVGPCFMQIPTPTPLPQSLNIRGVIFFFKNIDPPRPLPLVIRVMKLISEILYVHVQSKSMSKKLAAIEPN